MAIVRTYLCEECGTKFDKLHFERSEPAPECPGCAALAARQVPAGFAIGNGAASRAGDITQDVMEKDYGFSDFRDKVHEGEIGVKIPAPLAEQAGKFWNTPNTALMAAKAGATAAQREGSNPLTLIQKVAKNRGPSAAKVLCNPIASVKA